MDLQTTPECNFERATCRTQIAIGSLYPANPIRSCAEHYSPLVKAAGGLQEAVGLSIGPNYRSTCHTPAGGKATFTGISTKNSGEIRVVYEDVSAHGVTRGDAGDQLNYYPVADAHLSLLRHDPGAEAERRAVHGLRSHRSPRDPGSWR